MTDKELANLKLSNLKEDSDACGPVSHVEAFDHLLRFKNKAFGCSGDTPILCIPANPRTDSDLRLGAYIYQCWERDPADELARLRAENERLRNENQTFSDILQGKDDAIAELRHDVEELRKELDAALNPTPKEPPCA